MASPAPQHRMTLAEFLDWDDGTDTRYELVGGRILAMAPPAPEHAGIVGNLARLIGNHLKPPCRVYVEAGIVLPDWADTYYQADLAVSCTPLRRGSRWLPDPVLVAEVLSPSTLAHDRGVKVPDYGAVPTVREILLLYTAERRADLWRRSGEQWIVTTLVGDATLRLDAVGATLPLAEIFEDLVP